MNAGSSKELCILICILILCKSRLEGKQKEWPIDIGCPNASVQDIRRGLMTADIGIVLGLENDKLRPSMMDIIACHSCYL